MKTKGDEMSTKTKGTLLALAVLIGARAWSGPVSILGFDFAAPVVSDEADAPKQTGLIIYDTTADAFKGRIEGAWKTLSPPKQSEVRLNTDNGYGSTNTKIRRFSAISVNTGTDITYADSSTNGASFTINTDGYYTISYSDTFSGISAFGITLNSTELTTNVADIDADDLLAITTTWGDSAQSNVSWTGFLSSGDVIRAHANAIGASSTAADNVKFSIVRVN